LTAVKQIPDTLIYEMDNGQPIYYSGYRDVINANLPPEAIMGSSILQSLIKYIKVPPNTVIEVDTKAALEDYDDPQDYYN